MQLRARPLRPLPARPDADLPRRPRLPLRRARAADGGEGAVSAAAASRSSPSGSSPPATAASSRCSTARTSCSRSRARSRSPTSSRRAARPSRARTTSRSSRARSRPRTTRSGSSEVRALVAEARHDRRLRDGRRHPGAAELRRRRRLPLGRLRLAGVHLDARDLDADLGPRPGRLRAPRLPDQQAPAARGDHRVPARAPAEHPVEQRLHGVQAPRHRLRDGRARDAVPRPGHARRLRRDLPLLRPRLLRLLRADGDAEHRLAHATAEGARHGRRGGRRASSAPSTCEAFEEARASDG